MSEPGADTGGLPGEILEAIQRTLGPAEGAAVPLQGGITNRNFRVSLGGQEYVVRLCGKETSVLGIDRDAEVAAARAAHALGIGPDVAMYLPAQGCVVTAFVEARTVTSAELRRGALMTRVAEALRAFHVGAALPATFNTFRLAERYQAETLARGGSVPAAFEQAKAVADQIEQVLSGPEHAPVPCHNDLLAANFLLGSAGTLTIVDWEYAGMGDRYFDLGNLSVNNEFHEDDDLRLLEAYWRAPVAAHQLAALRLMRIISDYREATWGMVQSVLSELDFDYHAYADTHFQRLLQAASDPRHERWLDAASS